MFWYEYIITRIYEKNNIISRMSEKIGHIYKKGTYNMVNLDNFFRRIAERGLNASRLSEATGISTGNISDWKKGRSMPSATALDTLATYLDCSVDYLLGRTDNPEVNR